MSLAQTQNFVNKNPLTKEPVCQASAVLGKRIFSNKELVEMFPEAKKTIKALIKEDKDTLSRRKELYQSIYNSMYRKVKMQDVDIATSLVMCVISMDFIEHEMKNNNSGFKVGELVSARLERNRKLIALYEIMGKSSEDDFQLKKERAKAFPIENLVQVNKTGFAKCPFHNEKDPSFKVNRKLNLWHCFSGCGGGDSISLVMKLNNCSFKEAVNKLS